MEDCGGLWLIMADLWLICGFMVDLWIFIPYAMNHRVHSRVWIIVPQNDDLMVLSTQKNAISRSGPGQKRGFSRGDRRSREQ